MDEGGGELDALLISERELLDLVASPLAHAETVHPALGGVLGVGVGEAVQAAHVG